MGTSHNPKVVSSNLTPATFYHYRPSGYSFWGNLTVFSLADLPKRRFCMNRRPLVLKPSIAVSGFLQMKTAEGLSPNTLLSYKHLLNVWVSQTPDVPVDRLRVQHLREFFAWLRTDYKSRRFSGNERPLTAKSIRNAWIALSAFFTWACVEFKFDDPMQGFRRPSLKTRPSNRSPKNKWKCCSRASSIATLPRRSDGKNLRCGA